MEIKKTKSPIAKEGNRPDNVIEFHTDNMSTEEAAALERQIPDFIIGVVLMNDPSFGCVQLPAELVKKEDGYYCRCVFTAFNGETFEIQMQDAENYSENVLKKAMKHPEWIYLYLFSKDMKATRNSEYNAIVKISPGSEQAIQREMFRDLIIEYLKAFNVKTLKQFRERLRKCVASYNSFAMNNKVDYLDYDMIIYSWEEMLKDDGKLK